MTQTTRRTVVRTAAWATPTVALVGAAPAYAVTNELSVTFAPGGSTVVPSVEAPEFLDLKFDGATITLTGTPTEAQSVTITITFSATVGTHLMYAYNFDGNTIAPTGFTGETYDPNGLATQVFTYTQQVDEAKTIAIADGAYVGTLDPAIYQQGTFHVVVDAGAFGSAQWQVSTSVAGPAPAARSFSTNSNRSRRR